MNFLLDLLFCYYLVNVQITEITKAETGIKVLRAFNNDN